MKRYDPELNDDFNRNPELYDDCKFTYIEMEEHSDGEWVKWNDHKQEVAALKEENDRLRDDVAKVGKWYKEKVSRIAEVMKECDDLRTTNRTLINEMKQIPNENDALTAIAGQKCGVILINPSEDKDMVEIDLANILERSKK